MELQAQRKTQSAEALIKEFKRAQEEDLPRSAIKAAEELSLLGQNQHNLYHILIAQDAIWQNWRRIDQEHRTGLFRTLYELRGSSWLGRYEQAMLALYTLYSYERVRPSYFYQEDILRSKAKDSTLYDPTSWTSLQYQECYQELVEKLRRSQEVLNEPLGKYRELFGDDPVVGVETLGTELLGQLALLHSRERWEQTRYARLFTEAMGWIRPIAEGGSSVYFRSFVDFHSLRLQLSPEKGRLTNARAEELIYAFANKYVSTPEISNYITALRQYYPRRGVAYASFLEFFIQRATRISAKEQKELREAYRDALAYIYSLQVPQRVTGRDTLTVKLPSCYLVSKVRLCLYAAPKILRPDEVSWRLGDSDKPLQEKHLTLTLDSLGYSKEQTIEFPLPRVGNYCVYIEVTPDPRATTGTPTDEEYFTYTKYLTLERINTTNGSRLQWLEAMTGRPLASTWISLYEEADRKDNTEPEYTLLKKLKTDALGLHSVDEDAELYALSDASDPLRVDDGEIYEEEPDEDFTYDPNVRADMIWITPDRPAYRPGQTVRVYGWTAEVGRLIETARSLTGRAVLVRLYDTNSKEVARREAVPSRWGDFAVDFTLPTDRLSGRYFVRAFFQQATRPGVYTARSEAQTFEVAEYKRRATELLLTPPDPPYRVGQTVSIPGQVRTLSGTGVAGAKVTYRLVANRYSWAPWGEGARGGGDKILVDSVLTTDAEGRFVIPASLREVEPTADERSEDELFSWYRYRLYVSTTDGTGESHSETINLPVGRSVSAIQAWISPLINKEQEDAILTFRRYGYNEDNEPLSVSYSIRQDSRELHKGKVQLDSVIHLKTLLAPLSAGRYTLTYSADYGRGVSYEGKRTFYLYDGARDRRLPGMRLPLFIQPASGTYSSTRPARIYWMSGLEGGYVFYEVSYQGGRIAEGLLRSRAEAINVFDAPLPKNGFTPDQLDIHFYMVHHGVLTQRTATIRREQPKRSLTLKWDTFRDRILAGGQEQWSFTLSHEGKRVDSASVAVWMYDASLDEIGHLSLDYDRPLIGALSIDSLSSDFYRSHIRFHLGGSVPTPPWLQQLKDDEAKADFVYPPKPVTPPVKADDEYNQDVISDDSDDGELMMELSGALYGARATKKASAISIRGLASASNSRLEEVMVVGYASKDTQDEVLKPDEIRVLSNDSKNDTKPRRVDATKLAPLSIRTNFDESAYFYPFLRTDKQGKVSWSARVPETLTRWKLIVLAHTSDMKLLRHTESIEAYKDFSVRPNVPRFLREGDSIRISTTVSNGSKVAQRGLFTLELFEPKTKRTLCSREETFDLPAGNTTDIVLPVSGYEGLDSVGLRVIARGKTSSDGEQHLVPVVTDQEEMTESLAFNISRQGRHEIALDSLFPQNGFVPERGRFDLRIESNPLYLALSALPDLGYLKGSSALDAAAALYAQSVALEVSHAEGFREWFEARWNALPAAQRGRLSADDSLKLQTGAQTPWMDVADREAAREATLLKYLQNPSREVPLSRILQQLSDLQLSSGLWSWYPGMKGSPYVTESVLRLLLRVPSYDRLEQADRLRVQELVRRGFRGIEASIIEEYRRALRLKKKNSYSYTNLDYLYLVALAEHRGFYKPEGEVRKAHSFFYTELKRMAHKLPLSEKALAAVVFAYGRDASLAKGLIASLREYLQQDKTGMFYANRVFRGYFWINRTMPTMTSTLEAMRVVSPEAERETMREMQRWIINQKRATSWNSSLSTAEAIYALSLDIDGGSGTRRANSSSVELPFTDGQVYHWEGAYIEASRPFTASSRPERKMAVTTQADGEVWGSAFARYTIPTSQVEARGQELQIHRETFVQTLRDGKPTLLPLTEGYALRVGDRLTTKITLRLTQDLDFVTLRDPRPGFAEPIVQTASYQWGAGTGYYVEPKDKETNFYFDHLLRGEYVLEYEQYVTRTGLYSGLVTRAQSAYAPEYSAHTAASPRQLVQQMR